MNIAYIVLAHKLPEQVVRLVKKLNSPSATFLIHVDKKSAASIYRSIAEGLASWENVYFLKRHTIYYGDYGHVRATLEGIRKLIELHVSFDHVILLTGQDYPIKSNEEIETFLQESDQKSFIEYFPLPDERWGDEHGGLDRIDYWHLHWAGWELPLMKKVRSILPLPEPIWSGIVRVVPFRRQPPIDFRWFGGSAYWCLNRQCIEYVDELMRGNAGLEKYFAHIGIPGEIFFQTLLLNSPFKDQVVNKSLWYIAWSNTRHPAILNKQHFDLFMSTDNLFARKFDITVDETVLDMIDAATS